MSKERREISDTIENRDRIHVVMFFLSYVFLALGVGILVCIVKIQTTYHVDEKVIGLFRPSVELHIDPPVRGRILATDGRPLAISAPLYDIYMDCTVKKQYYKDTGKDSLERAWRSKARELGVYLSNQFRDKSADQYANAILKGRDNNNRYLSIRKNVDLETVKLLKTFPLYREGTYTGGIIVEKHEERIYPYDSLARRVIGYVKEQNRIGLESSFDTELHGTEGYEWRRVTDNKRWIRRVRTGRQRHPHHHQRGLPGYCRPRPPRPDQREPGRPRRHLRDYGNQDRSHPRHGEPLPRGNAPDGPVGTRKPGPH